MTHLDFCLIDPQNHAHYLERFARIYPDEIVKAIPDSEAWAWMRESVPFLECPDTALEEAYYFRW
jgi:hypothetical protein